MVVSAIKINGVLGSRDDLSLGIITLTNNNNTDVTSWLWEFISVPPGSASIIVGPATATATFIADSYGSYLIKLTVSDGIATVYNKEVAAIKTTHLELRAPAAGETTEFGTTYGWAQAIYEAFNSIDDSYDYLKEKSLNEAYIDGRIITINNGPVVFNASDAEGLSVDGYIGLKEINNPAALGNTGSIYTKDDSGDTELFYIDDSGNVVQITKDGGLDPDSISHSLDSSYNDGRTITVDSGPVVFNGTASTFVLDIDGYAMFTGDLEFTDTVKGIILKAPNGTRFRVTIDNTGHLVASEL